MRHAVFYLFILSFFCGTWHQPIYSQENLLRADSLPEIEVRALRIRITPAKSPLSVSVMDESRIRAAQNLLSLSECLPSIPGVVVQNDANYAQDLRISIRGFGARAGFGIRGIRILSDGFPESSPDGQGQVDQIDPTNLDHLEVIRGPSAGLYGNASGGIIHLYTLKPLKSGLALRTVAGSFGFRQYRMQGTIIGKNSSLLSAVSRVSVKGYRALSAMQATSAILKYEGFLRRDSTFSWLLIVNYTDSPVGDDPGGLSAAQVALNPKMANPLNVQYNAGESVQHARIGLSLVKQLNSKQVLSGKVWTIRRDFENRLPFRSGGQATFERIAAGGSLTWEGNALKSNALKWMLGMETDYQSDRRARFDNLDGVRGNLNLRQNELFNSAGLFGQVNYQLSEKNTLAAGLRTDWINAKVTDRFLGDGNQSGQRQFNRLSPWAGITRQLRPWVNIFFNATTNFETPTLIELSNNPAGTGGFSQFLAPQQTRALEIGLKGQAKGNLFWELALFKSKTFDEISPYELPDQPGRTYYQNAGITSRRGLELACDYQPSQKWRIWLNYGRSRFRFEEFNFLGSDLSGKLLPGLPAQQGQVSARYTHKSGWITQTGCRYTGKMFADQLNTVEIPAGIWLSWRIGHEWRRLGVFAAAENLADAQPYNNIRINAAGSRYFEPGQGRSLSFGLTLKSG
jgi:iron complex outermembrane receptor protein